MDKKQKYEKILSTPKISELIPTYDAKTILKKLYGKNILCFVKTITKEMSHCDLTFLYKNLSSIKISNSNFIFNIISPRFKTVASYSVVRNKIFIKNENSIYHELFHLASSYYSREKETIFTGFKQTNGNNSIGTGINEGYTELLSERYFKDEKDNLSYPFNVIIVKSLENIIGKEKMEQLYMKADLYNLIQELKKYNNHEKSVIDFIKNVDFICDNVDISKWLSKKQRKLSIYKINSVLTFLINSFTFKAYNISANERLDTLKNNIMSLVKDGEEYSLEKYPSLKTALIQLNELEMVKRKV